MFTIVIPTMWKSATLIDFLHKLTLTDLVTNIVIINNDYKNTPRSDILFHHKINMVDFGENIYVNPAWNYGVAISENENVCLMNDDISFDTLLFKRVKEFVEQTNDVGSIGFSPGAVYLNQPQHTSNNIDFIEHYSGQDLLGYGCLIFVKKSLWRHIPDELKIYCGDAFIFDRSIWLNLKNYLITNMTHEIAYASTATSKDESGKTIAEGFIEVEGPWYENTVRKNNYKYMSPYIDYSSIRTPRKLVIDAVIFFNELDILEGRLEYLYDSIDYFVIVECNLTHSGKEKPLNYLDNIKRYEKYRRKIIYAPFIVNKNDYNFEFISQGPDYSSGAWKLERAQRQYITEAIRKFNQDAFVIISDVDEIPDKYAIEFAKNNADIQPRAAVFLQQFISYTLENLSVEQPWYGSVFTHSDMVLSHGAQWMRENARQLPAIYNAGWHLTYFGGSAKIIEKLESFAHQELDTGDMKDPSKIKNAIEEGLSLYGEKTFNKVDKSFYPPDFYKIFSRCSAHEEENQSTLNLVMGAAFNLNPRDIKRFVLSFRKFNKDDDIVLILNQDVYHGLRNFFTKNNVTPVINESYKIIDILPHSYRFYLYSDYLKNNPKYRSILLTDVRDVIFQGNPFEKLPSDFLYLFKEDSTLKIQNEDCNTHWIKHHYGDEIFERVKNNNIICSGTILGSQKRIIEIVGLINHEILRLKQEQKTDVKIYADQSIVNFLYNQPNDRFYELKESGDIVGTIGCSMYMPQSSDKITSDGEFIYVNGNKPPVVHQYDRNSQFLEMMSNLYD